MDVQRETIISRHYHVAGIKNHQKNKVCIQSKGDNSRWTDGWTEGCSGFVFFFQKKKKKTKTRGPRFAHLNDIATADMQMLCNIFPILSSQLMKISFEQFLVLKKNIWA